MDLQRLLRVFSAEQVFEGAILLITTAALVFLWITASRNAARTSWFVTAGLLLLLLRAVLDITDNLPSLYFFPVLGGGDPVHNFFKNWVAGISGLFLLCWGICRDAMRNWRMFRDLNRETQFQEAVLSEIEAGILVLDRDKNVVFLNPRALSALETHYNSATRPARPPAHLAAPAGGTADPGVSPEPANPRPETAERIYAVREKLIESVESGDPLLLRTWWDVTPWEEDQRLSQEFVYAVSHELRTPLTSIYGYLELALGDPQLGEESREHLEIARINADRLRSVVEDLLYLSQIEGGAVRYRLQPLKIGPLVEEALQALATEFAAKHIELSVLREETPEWVTVDRERLLQVLANVLSNALKYTPAGGRITVSTVAVQDEVRIDVEDTGIGIPLEDREKVFTRFYRSDAARKLGVGGTGLGLAITKSLVEAMGGTIWFASAVGKGSTFSVSLLKGVAQDLELQKAAQMPQQVASS